MWGPHGQKALAESRVCLLNAGPTGTEVLKSLVLPGVGHITIVDGGLVTREDLANNFFVAPACVGQPRAKVTLELLLEMNPEDVAGAYVARDPLEVLREDPAFFNSFSLVVATQLPEAALLPLAELLQARGTPLLTVRSYGLVGVLRVLGGREHCVVETHAALQHDLRMRRPFPALRAHVDAVNLAPGGLSDLEFHRVPAPVILLKALDAWRAGLGGGGGGAPAVPAPGAPNLPVPRTPEEKRAVKDLICTLWPARVVDPNPLNPTYTIFSAGSFGEAAGLLNFKLGAEGNVKPGMAVLRDGAAAALTAASPPFWFVASAMRAFCEVNGGAMPHTGCLDDFDAGPEQYIKLGAVYKAQGEAEVAWVDAHVRASLARLGLPPHHVDPGLVARMCRHGPVMGVVRWAPAREELWGPALTEGLADLLSEGSAAGPPVAAAWYFGVRAADEFALRNGGRAPGSRCEAVGTTPEADEEALWALMGALGAPGGALELPGTRALPREVAREVTRWGAAEIHTVASVVGAAAAQEALKLITKQWMPTARLFVFEGISGTAQQVRADKVE